jgi:hypothetical protein
MGRSPWWDLIDGISARLADDPAGRPFLAELAALRDLRPEPTASAPMVLPVQRYWPAAGAGDPLGVLMAAVDQDLAASWQQNPNYRAAPPAVGFLQNYGYLECAGPAAPYRCASFRLGLLVLGPKTLYPAHRHPAEEIYLPLGSGKWWRDGAAWRARTAGEIIHHPPMCAHATQSDADALAAIYLWRGEIAPTARLS